MTVFTRIRNSLHRHSISRWPSLWICPRRTSPRLWSSIVSGRRCAPTSREGLKSGVNGTPTFYINGTRHDGPFELEDLVAAIDAALERVKLEA